MYLAALWYKGMNTIWTMLHVSVPCRFNISVDNWARGKVRLQWVLMKWALGGWWKWNENSRCLSSDIMSEHENKKQVCNVFDSPTTSLLHIRLCRVPDATSTYCQLGRFPPRKSILKCSLLLYLTFYVRIKYCTARQELPTAGLVPQSHENIVCKMVQIFWTGLCLNSFLSLQYRKHSWLVAQTSLLVAHFLMLHVDNVLLRWGLII